MCDTGIVTIALVNTIRIIIKCSSTTSIETAANYNSGYSFVLNSKNNEMVQSDLQLT